MTIDLRKARAAVAFARETWRNDGAEGETVHVLANAVEQFAGALAKVNVIRDSIIGVQGFNFSEHAYPLVAALDEAGFVGLPYSEARANIGTLIERATKAEERVVELARALRNLLAVTPESLHGPYGHKILVDARDVLSKGTSE